MIRTLLLSTAAVGLLISGAATAADVKTPLICKLGAASGTSQSVTVSNSTKHALKNETIVNYVVTTKMGSTPGNAEDCSAIDHDVAPKGQVTHTMTMSPGTVALKCSAFLSSAHPTVEHDASGGSMTQCDP